MQGMGKILLVAGLLIAGIGLALMFADKVPFLGRLPGDINIKRENFEFHFPLGTSILISLVLTGLLWLISHFKGR
ncbi:MAG: DUF2905 domain-containing protein [Bacteroidota bacterium]